MAVVVLPTPPFWLAMAIALAIWGNFNCSADTKLQCSTWNVTRPLILVHRRAELFHVEQGIHVEPCLRCK